MRFYPLALALLLTGPLNPTWASDVKQATTIRLVAAANTVDTVISEVILHRAYARLGLRLAITRYPAERALKLADGGRADGDVQRIDGLGKHYPNLIQLYPAINYIEGSAFTAGKDIAIDGWDSLRPYRIGLIRGIKFAELNTEGMDRHFVGDYAALFKMLRGGRAELAPKLERVFRDMQTSGELTNLRQTVIAELLRRAERGLPICDNDYGCFQTSGGSSRGTAGPATP